ncbi:ECF-type sigma factor [Engelhardtia mirabilis]
MDPLPGPEDATRLLRRAAQGGQGGDARLIELLQPELRRLAEQAMARERSDHTLQPTALVNEVWLKLFEPDQVSFADRQHFLALSAQVMRQVLVDHARARRRLKRGGGWQRVQLQDAQGELQIDEVELDLLALDAALEDLRILAPRQAQVVELRFFGGLSVEQTAQALSTSESSIAREWRFARAWLATRLGGA